MEIDEFETRFQAAMDTTLNQLQGINLLLAQLETQNLAAGESLQSLSQLVEEFIDQQRRERSTSS
jgi:hypothetical protein